MATIYRFIVEQKTSGGGGSRGGRKEGSTNKKGAAKKGKKTVGIFSGGKGGVEHNRYLRPINPVMNKITNGYWEKGMRLGRAGLGLVKVDATTGAFAGLSFVAIAIIISFILQTIMKYQAQDREIANKLNAQDYNMLENGVGAVHGQYSISVNLWNGRRTYNQNK